MAAIITRDELLQKLAAKKSQPYKVKSTVLDGKAVKDVDMSKRTVTGFWNTCNYFDSDADVLLKGATAKSILERGPNSNAKAVAKIKHLMDHKWDSLLTPGKPTVVEEKEIDGLLGTYFETLMSNTTAGNDALINYQNEVYDQHSIGFLYMDGSLVTADDADWKQYVGLLLNPKDAEDNGYMFVWKEVMLYEGSTVMFGANSLTPYLGVKNGKLDRATYCMKMAERMDILQKQVTSGNQSDETLKNIEMQFAQLKQLVHEMDYELPSVKDDLIKGKGQNSGTDTTKKSNSILSAFA